MVQHHLPKALRFIFKPDLQDDVAVVEKDGGMVVMFVREVSPGFAL